MTQRHEQLAEHCEGHGWLLPNSGTPISVRYILDRWLEEIPSGSGTSTRIQRMDGFVWWDGESSPSLEAILETGNGSQFRVKLHSRRTNRASLFVVGLAFEESA
jgi:hypothetical protein